MQQTLNSDVKIIFYVKKAEPQNGNDKTIPM